MFLPVELVQKNCVLEKCRFSVRTVDVQLANIVTDHCSWPLGNRVLKISKGCCEDSQLFQIGSGLQFL